MSYCVNCGVELDKTCSVCPLCNTKVINPNQPVDTVSPKPYPVDKGYVDSGIRHSHGRLSGHNSSCLRTFEPFFYHIFPLVLLCHRHLYRPVDFLPADFLSDQGRLSNHVASGRSGHRHVLRHHCLAPSRQRLVHSYRPAPDYSGHTGSFLLRHQYGPSKKLYTFPGCHPRGRNRHLLCLCRTADAPLLRRANGSFLVRHCPHLRYYHRRDTGDYPAAKPVEGGSPEKDAYIKIRTYNYAFKNVKKQS